MPVPPTDRSTGSAEDSDAHLASARPSILVVEDNPDTGLLLCTLLDEADLEPVLVQTYEDALTRASERTFDLLLLDINLGSSRTGADLLEELRTHEAYAQTPAIACTANVLSRETPNWFTQAGFNAMVAKPFSFDQLFSVIDKQLSSRSTS
jgi:CheY-like chemotaxis protein